MEMTFFAPAQTGLGAHPASCTMGTGSLYLGGGVVALTSHTQSSAKVKERLELCLYSPCGPSWPVLG